MNAIRIQQQIQEIKKRQNETTFLRTTDGAVAEDIRCLRATKNLYRRAVKLVEPKLT